MIRADALLAPSLVAPLLRRPSPRHAWPLASVATLALLACGGTEESRPRTPLAAPAPAVEDVRLGGSPGAVTATDEAVWVADGRRSRLMPLDARTGEPAGPPVRVEAPLALAARGRTVWVASGVGVVSRVDGARAQRLASVRDPGGIAVGDDAVWVSSRLDATVTALDPRSGAPRGRPVRVGRAPGDVVAAFGSVWVANTQDGTVSRIDPRTLKTVGSPVEVADGQVLALAAGETAIWVAASDSPQNADVVLRRLDPESGELDETTVPLAAGSGVRLAAGLGSVWATDAGSMLPGSRRRDPALQRVAAREQAALGRPIPVGQSPGGVAVGAGAVWVTSAGDGKIRRIVPRQGAGDRP